MVQDHDERDTNCLITSFWEGVTLFVPGLKYITYNDLPIDHEERRGINRTYVNNHHLAFNPAQPESIVMDGLRDIFPRSAVSMAGKFSPYTLRYDLDNATWHEKPGDDNMLRLSINAAAEGGSPKYTATHMETVVGGETHSMYILEPRQDIISWMDMKEDTKELIRTMCPTYLRGQPLKVFMTGTPPDRDDQYTVWLRNSLLTHYPDNMYLVHLLDSLEPPDSDILLGDFMDNRMSWTPLQYANDEETSSVPTIGIYKDEGENCDDVLHIMHITVGSLVIHLVGKKNEEEFNQFAFALTYDDMGVPVHVGFIHIPSDGETGIHLPNWTSP
jgi:hypothetical protein